MCKINKSKERARIQHSISHFISQNHFSFITGPSAQLTIDMKMIFYSDANKAHFHTNGSALSLVFKPRFLFNMLAITAEIAERICPMLGNPRQSSILDSEFHTVDSRFQLLDSNLCQWKYDSGSQNLRNSRFLELYSRFQNPGFRIPQANFPRFWIPQAKVSCIPAESLT